MARLILGLHTANERHHYKVTPSLIGWAQIKSQRCTCRELERECGFSFLEASSLVLKKT